MILPYVPNALSGLTMRYKVMKDYWTCHHCQANLDHGEKCDCAESRLGFVVVPNDYGKHDKEVYSNGI